MYVDKEFDLTVSEQRKVLYEGWHIVKNNKRAKLLRKRGEYIFWSLYYQAFIWDFQSRGLSNGNRKRELPDL